MPSENRFAHLKKPMQQIKGQDTTPTAPPVASPQGKVTIPGLDDDAPIKEALERLNVEIPVELHQRLKLYCTEKRKSKKDVVNALIAWFLDQNESID